MNFTDYKFRPSGLGNLMTKPRKKDAELSETAKSYLRELFLQEVYGRTKDTSNKFTEKGLYTEEESFNKMQTYYGEFLSKNKVTLQNEILRGTPDIILNDRVSDAKSSWDIFTFMEADGNNKDYYWQGMAYMALTGKKLFDLCYCLNNAPEHLIVSEKTRLMYRNGLQDGSEELSKMETQTEKNMTFDDIPAEKRIKVFTIEFDEDAYSDLAHKINSARRYLNSLNL